MASQGGTMSSAFDSRLAIRLPAVWRGAISSFIHPENLLAERLQVARGPQNARWRRADFAGPTQHLLRHRQRPRPDALDDPPRGASLACGNLARPGQCLASWLLPHHAGPRAFRDAARSSVTGGRLPIPDASSRTTDCHTLLEFAQHPAFRSFHVPPLHSSDPSQPLHSLKGGIHSPKGFRPKPSVGTPIVASGVFGVQCRPESTLGRYVIGSWRND